MIGLSLLVFGATTVLTPIQANAEFAPGSPTGALDSVGENSELKGDDPFEIIAKLVNIALGLLGIVFFLLLLFAGWKWMTARGDTGKTEEATKLITQAVVGLIIILSAKAISTFAIEQLVNSTK